nr:helix-turn-helix domain-containing protein [Metabacillus iocasae]
MEETEYLKANVGEVQVETIARNLDRSYNAVIQKLTDLGIGNTREILGLLTFGELARYLNVDRNTVKSWAEHHNLPYISKITRKTKRFYFVSPEDFWTWAAHHKEKINFAQIESGAILPEPAWFHTEKNKNRQCHKRIYKHWSIKEDKELMLLHSKGWKKTCIAKELQRSVNSVYKRITRLLHHQQKHHQA